MNPFLGEIRLWPGTFAPLGWAFCAGQLLSISNNEALYSVMGTTYGGNGITNFALPDLRSRVPVHMGQLAGGSNYVIGQVSGVEQVTLDGSTMPSHSHPLFSARPATTNTPANNTTLSDATVGIDKSVSPYILYDGSNQIPLASASLPLSESS